MTKFDIRIRRKRFTQSRIERHKDFQNLLATYDRTSRKKTRGIMVLVFLMIIIITILLAFLGTMYNPENEKPRDEIEASRRSIKIQPSQDEVLVAYKF